MNTVVRGSTPQEPFVLLESFDPARGGRSFLFERPVNQIRANHPAEVVPALEQIEAAIRLSESAGKILEFKSQMRLDLITAKKTVGYVERA